MSTRKGTPLPAEPKDRIEELTERIDQREQRIIGSLLEDPKLWDDQLSPEQFTLAAHRKIVAAIAECHSKGYSANLDSVCTHLGEDAGYAISLVAGCMPENYVQYLRNWREAIAERDWQRQLERLPELTTSEERRAALECMTTAINGNGQAPDWRSLFHSRQELESAPDLSFRIDRFLQADGITLIGGLSGHGKTLIMLAMAKALLEGTPLFGYKDFSVPCPSKRVLYLIPESAKGPLHSRLKKFRIDQYVGNGDDSRLFVYTLSSPQQIELSDPRLLKAAEGADVFLDTAVRFMQGSENEVESTRVFAENLFRLLNAGARSITGAHHSPKSFSNQDYMTLENILRGSGDIGAMLCTAWGVRQIDTVRNRIYVENVKPRDFEPCQPFILEGRPHIDQNGDFKMHSEPGTAGELRDYLVLKNGKSAGRPGTPDKDTKLAQALDLRKQGDKSIRDIAKATGVPKSTLEGWLWDYDREQTN